MICHVCICLILLIDTWVTSTFWLFWIMLLWTPVYTYLIKSLLSFLLGLCLEGKLMDPMIIVCFVFWGAAILFSIVTAPFYILISNAQMFHLSTSLSILVFSLPSSFTFSLSPSFSPILLPSFLSFSHSFSFFFSDSQPDGCEVVPISTWFHFLSLWFVLFFFIFSSF